MTVRQKSMFEAEMSMTIKNIRREDLGSYICVAKNSLGDVESKIRLYGNYFTLLFNFFVSSSLFITTVPYIKDNLIP